MYNFRLREMMLIKYRQFLPPKTKSAEEAFHAEQLQHGQHATKKGKLWYIKCNGIILLYMNNA